MPLLGIIGALTLIGVGIYRIVKSEELVSEKERYDKVSQVGIIRQRVVGVLSILAGVILLIAYFVR